MPPSGVLCQSCLKYLSLQFKFCGCVCSAVFKVLCCVWSKRCGLWRAVQLLFVLLTLLNSVLHYLPDKQSADREPLFSAATLMQQVYMRYVYVWWITAGCTPVFCEIRLLNVRWKRWLLHTNIHCFSHCTFIRLLFFNIAMYLFTVLSAVQASDLKGQHHLLDMGNGSFQELDRVLACSRTSYILKEI